MKSVLLITDREELQTFFAAELPRCRVGTEGDFQRALAAFERIRHDFVFAEIGILQAEFSGDETASFKACFQALWNVHRPVHVVVMAPRAQTADALLAVRAGADNYLVHPIGPGLLPLLTERARASLQRDAELEYLRDRFWSLDSHDLIRSESPAMRKVYRNVKAVAPTPSTVLLCGETGVGKSVLARIIHAHSPRRQGPYIEVHCGAIPDNLIESELFGHERGAFTSAVKRKLGKFELAHQGTIFLDEIGTVTPSVQIKLLQVLQESRFQRVGGESDIQVNIRIIAASNADLKELTEQGRFRKDLFYRLNVFPIEVPALRERCEDLPHLVSLFLEKLNRTHGKGIRSVKEGVLAMLADYRWPGNIRELENLLERAYILEESAELTPESFPAEFSRPGGAEAELPIDVDLPLAEARQKTIDHFEHRYLLGLLRQNGGQISETSQTAGIGVRQLHKLMKKHSLKKEDFKQGLA